MGTGTAVATGDLITAAKMNLKLEGYGNNEEDSTLTVLRLKASGSLPAGTVAYLALTNTNDMTLNALTTGIFDIRIAGTSEFTFDATSLNIANGNRIDFNATAGAFAALVVDVNNNELLETYGTASAVNHITLRNSATGTPVILGANGTGADANSGIRIVDSNGNEMLDLTTVASAVNGIAIRPSATGLAPRIGSNGNGAEANIGIIVLDSNANEETIFASVASSVNEITITNAATGNRPQISASGDDTNIGINILAKGTGAILFDNGTDPVDVRLMGAASGYNSILTDVNGNELIDFQGVASAVNEIAVLNAATGNRPTLSTRGGDANIGFTINMKGTGPLVIDSDTDPVEVRLMGAATGYNSFVGDLNGNELLEFQGVGSAVNQLAVLNAATTANPELVARGGDTNIGLSLTPKGSGTVNFKYASVALGGGAAPTLGTIGGSGPATAGQNAWLQVQINGTNSWLAFWR